MEIYYQLDYTKKENLDFCEAVTEVYSIIAVVDGLANVIDTAHCTKWPDLAPDDILDYIHDALQNQLFQDLWDESAPDSFFPAAELSLRYPDAVKYTSD